MNAFQTGTPPEPFVRHLLHRLRDPDEFSIAVSGASLRADFLGRQRCATVVEQFQTPDWTIDFHEAEVRARIVGFPPAGWASVALIRGEGESAWYGRTVRRGFLVCTPPSEAIDGWIGPGFRCSSIGVPPWIWQQTRMAAGLGEVRIGPVVAELPASRFATLERGLMRLRGAMSSAQAGTEAGEFVKHFMTLVWEIASRSEGPRESVRNRARLARRAEEWLRDHHGEGIGMTELCLAMGVSRREIEYAFRENFASSPREFLERIRLNAIRRDLNRSGSGGPGQVTRIALDHGIAHLGRFPALYRSLFGELPRQTLARSVARGTSG